MLLLNYFLKDELPIVLLFDLLLEIYRIHRLVELLSDLHANLPHITIHSIEQVAVVEDQLYVCYELVPILVLVLSQSFPDGGEVHRSLNHLQIVGDLQGHWVHWVVEELRVFGLPELVQYFPRIGFPIVVFESRENHVVFEDQLWVQNAAAY